MLQLCSRWCPVIPKIILSEACSGHVWGWASRRIWVPGTGITQYGHNFLVNPYGFDCSIFWGDPMEWTHSTENANRCWSHYHISKLSDFLRKNTLDPLAVGHILGCLKVHYCCWKKTGLLLLLMSSRWFWLGLCDTMGNYEIPSLKSRSMGHWPPELQLFLPPLPGNQPEKCWNHLWKTMKTYEIYL
jgi:hypothetical protein